MTTNKVFLSPYKIFWVEFRPEYGRATKADCNKIEGWRCTYHIADRHTKCYYKHFASKEKAVDFLQNFNKTLSKKYECRLFTDKQFGMRRQENGYKVPFTEKQRKNVYVI